jgi:ribosomal protein S18 acetylase RimI-like enzyme
VTGPVNYRLVAFGADAPGPARDLARLHAALLPASPVALLGRRFMEGFYYRILPAEGLLFGAVAYVDGQPAGFVAATGDRRGFMRAALKRYWPRVIGLVGLSLLAAPRSLGPVWHACRVVRARRPDESGRREGEILSLGVLPAYREPAFIRRSGRRIATELLDLAVGRLRTMGVDFIGAAVGAGNTEARLFYLGLGWDLHRRCAEGWGPAAVEFRWRA